MNRRLVFPLVLAVFVALPALAQHDEGKGQDAHHDEGRGQNATHEDRGQNPPRANQGHVPPPPPKRDNPHAKPEPERQDHGRVNNTPHVNNNHWYGHDSPNDKRFHIDHPFEHGHFEHFGPSYRYRIERFDPDHHRFWLPGGFFFEVASWDWPVCADWCWDCADDFVIYEDTDHVGWYLLYNVHTGVYVHVQYMGT